MEVKVDVPSEDLNSTRSDMRPLLHDRDPKRVNKSLKNDNGQLQIETGAFLEGGLAEALATCHASTHPVICRVTFEDVIAEPPSVRSFDRVWLWSHALFEVSRLWCYRLISLLLAVPVSLAAGILFAVLSCLHIWLIMPCVQLLLINMHWVQTVWASILNILISPFFTSIGQCCGRITIQLAKDKDSKTCCV